MSTNPLVSVATKLLDVKQLFEKMTKTEQEKFRTSTRKDLADLEKLIDGIRARCGTKEPVACPHCDKKFLNLKLHITNSHTCDYCETEVADKYKHWETCAQMIEQLTDLAKERGLVYVHSELAEYKVQAGNYYEWDDKTHTVGAYAGRLRGDGTLDKTATESFCPEIKEHKPCPHCDKSFMNLASHILNIHTCGWCMTATVRDLVTHRRGCTDYIKGRNQAAKEQGLVYIYSEDDDFKVQGTKVYAYDEDTRVIGAYVGRLQANGTLDKTVAEVNEEVDVSQVTVKKKKERIPTHIKTIVWSKYIGGAIPEAKCYCCQHERIEIRNFECGHVTAEAKGGPLTVNNLRPICRGCNGAMGTMSMEEYCQKFFGRSVLMPEAEDVFGIYAEDLLA